MTAKIWTTAGDKFTMETVPAEVRDAIKAAVTRGRASGCDKHGEETYRWNNARDAMGARILDQRAYGDKSGETLPEWMRTPTGA